MANATPTTFFSKSSLKKWPFTETLFKLYDTYPPTYTLGPHILELRERILNFKLKIQAHSINRLLSHHHDRLSELFNTIDVLIPIPNSWLGIFHYGFYPTLALCERLSHHLQKPIIKKALIMHRGLGQIKRTPKQTSKLILLRKWLRPGPAIQVIKNKHILLIDDVYNSGATLKVAASIIQNTVKCKLSAFTLSFTHLHDNHAYPINAMNVKAPPPITQK